jgi:hypothetical protein
MSFASLVDYCPEENSDDDIPPLVFDESDEVLVYNKCMTLLKHNGQYICTYTEYNPSIDIRFNCGWKLKKLTDKYLIKHIYDNGIMVTIDYDKKFIMRHPNGSTIVRYPESTNA